MCMESELCCGLLQCSCYTEHGRYSVLTACRNCAVLEHCWVCVVCWSLIVMLHVKFYCRWTWQIWVIFYVYKTVEWAKLSTLFIQCIWNRLSACSEFCGVCSWQNGTRCRDGVKVLWCHSHLVWLVFEASIPTCTCFPSEDFLWLVSVAFFLFFVLSFRNGKRKRSIFLFT